MVRDVAEKTGYKEGGKTMESLKYTVEGALERGIVQGMEKGLAHGMEKGRAEGQQSVILNMLKDKMDIQAIAKYVGVSKEQVLELQKQAGL